MRDVAGFEVRREHAVARARHRGHHAVGADGDRCGRHPAADRLRAEAALAHARASPRRCCRRRSCPAARVGREARRLVAAPHDLVRRRLDLGDLVAVDQLLVAGEVEHLASRRRACAAPIENSTALPRPPPTSTTVSPPRRLGRRAGRPHQDHRLAGLRAARTGRTSRPSRARWSRPGPSSRSTQAPVSARPSIARRVPSTLGASVSKFCRR